MTRFSRSLTATIGLPAALELETEGAGEAGSAAGEGDAWRRLPRALMEGWTGGDSEVISWWACSKAVMTVDWAGSIAWREPGRSEGARSRSLVHWCMSSSPSLPYSTFEPGRAERTASPASSHRGPARSLDAYTNSRGSCRVNAA